MSKLGTLAGKYFIKWNYNPTRSIVIDLTKAEAKALFSIQQKNHIFQAIAHEKYNK